MSRELIKMSKTLTKPKTTARAPRKSAAQKPKQLEPLRIFLNGFVQDTSLVPSLRWHRLRTAIATEPSVKYNGRVLKMITFDDTQLSTFITAFLATPPTRKFDDFFDDYLEKNVNITSDEDPQDEDEISEDEQSTEPAQITEPAQPQKLLFMNVRNTNQFNVKDAIPHVKQSVQTALSDKQITDRTVREDVEYVIKRELRSLDHPLILDNLWEMLTTTGQNIAQTCQIVATLRVLVQSGVPLNMISLDKLIQTAPDFDKIVPQLIAESPHNRQLLREGISAQSQSLVTQIQILQDKFKSRSRTLEKTRFEPATPAPIVLDYTSKISAPSEMDIEEETECGCTAQAPITTSQFDLGAELDKFLSLL